MVDARSGPTWSTDSSSGKYFAVASIGGVQVKSKMLELQQIY